MGEGQPPASASASESGASIVSAIDVWRDTLINVASAEKGRSLDTTIENLLCQQDVNIRPRTLQLWDQLRTEDNRQRRGTFHAKYLQPGVDFINVPNLYRVLLYFNDQKGTASKVQVSRHKTGLRKARSRIRGVQQLEQQQPVVLFWRKQLVCLRKKKRNWHENEQRQRCNGYRRTSENSVQVSFLMLKLCSASFYFCFNFQHALFPKSNGF